MVLTALEWILDRDQNQIMAYGYYCIFVLSQDLLAS